MSSGASCAGPTPGPSIGPGHGRREHAMPPVAVGLLALGGVLAVGLVLVARRGGAQRERRVFAIGLVVATVVYVVAAAIELHPAALLMEGLGVIAFGAVALAGARRWPALLATGWALHVAWDVGLHLVVQQPYIGAWYPTLCISFDLVVAGYVGWQALRAPLARATADQPTARVGA